MVEVKQDGNAFKGSPFKISVGDGQVRGTGGTGREWAGRGTGRRGGTGREWAGRSVGVGVGLCDRTEAWSVRVGGEIQIYELRLSRLSRFLGANPIFSRGSSSHATPQKKQTVWTPLSFKASFSYLMFLPERLSYLSTAAFPQVTSAQKVRVSGCTKEAKGQQVNDIQLDLSHAGTWVHLALQKRPCVALQAFLTPAVRDACGSTRVVRAVWFACSGVRYAVVVHVGLYGRRCAGWLSLLLHVAPAVVDSVGLSSQLQVTSGESSFGHSSFTKLSTKMLHNFDTVAFVCAYTSRLLAANN